MDRLQDIRGYGGSLEPSGLDNILSLLRQLETTEEFPAEKAHELWQQLHDEFQKLVHNSASYLAALNSARAEELMLTEAFLAFKDSLTIYLQNFVHGLQRTGVRIQGLLTQMPPDNLTAFFNTIIEDRKHRPTLDEQLSPKEELRQLREK